MTFTLSNLPTWCIGTKFAFHIPMRLGVTHERGHFVKLCQGIAMLTRIYDRYRILLNIRHYQSFYELYIYSNVCICITDVAHVKVDTFLFLLSLLVIVWYQIFH